ncbi:hypothetical protein G6L37_23980 [Agrobacterium rubi]|nr:hypothetical protein [Agrobacterium rubi]NTF21465.1 hypothetical protein [Agrobacterium rubi]NTF28322.1 hypothetical protein [Agrobacterium rubi]
MDLSLSQTALQALFTILSLASACSIARYPRNANAGVLLGVLVSVVLLIVTSGIVGFIAHIIPFGQIDFWLANLLNYIS